KTKFGVTAVVAAAGAPAAGGAGGAPAAAEETTEVDVILTSAGEKKNQVIKVVRELTSLGLNEAKDLVDNPPEPVEEGAPEAGAEQIKGKREEQGASVELKWSASWRCRRGVGTARSARSAGAARAPRRAGRSEGFRKRRPGFGSDGSG